MSEQQYRYPTKADIGKQCECCESFYGKWQACTLLELMDSLYPFRVDGDDGVTFITAFCRIPIDRQAVQESIPCESIPAYPPLRERLIVELAKSCESIHSIHAERAAEMIVGFADAIIARMNEEGGQQ